MHIKFTMISCYLKASFSSKHLQNLKKRKNKLTDMNDDTYRTTSKLVRAPTANCIIVVLHGFICNAEEQFVRHLGLRFGIKMHCGRGFPQPSSASPQAQNCGRNGTNTNSKRTNNHQRVQTVLSFGQWIS